ncbi:MAG: tape measure protein [Peptococcaceae bacterium]|nr:tape measure protein [Peptococcaceae bacterium]
MSYDGTLKFDTKLDTGDFEKGTSRLGDIVKGLAVFKVLEAGFNMVKNSVGGAIERVDILNAYPRVLQQMGVSAEDAAASTQKLSLGLQGLPTTLPEAVAMSQQFIIMGKDADTATRSTLGINNALLASGANFEKAQRGGDAYITMLQQGKVDMAHWNTLLQTAPYAVSKLAESFEFGKDGARKLYDALKDGSITMDELNDRMILLSEETGGFAEVAKTSTAGIGTSWQNMKNAVVRGVADIITSLDDGLGETRWGGIAGVIDEAKTIISKAFAKISAGAKDLMKNMDWKSIEKGINSFKSTASKAFDIVGKALKVLTNNMGVVVPLVKLFLAAWAGYKVLQMASTAMETINKAMKVAQALYTVTIGLKKAEATATTIAMQAQVRETGAKAAATLAQYGLNASLLACPLTWIVVGIAAVVAALVIFSDTTGSVSKRMKELSTVIEDNRRSMDEFSNSLRSAQKESEKSLQMADSRYHREIEIIDAMEKAVSAGKDKASLDKEMTELARRYNEAKGETLIAWDSEKGAIYDVTQEIHTNTEALKKNAEAAREAAKQKAYQKLLDDTTAALIDFKVEQQNAAKNTQDFWDVFLVASANANRETGKTLFYTMEMAKALDLVFAKHNDEQMALTKSREALDIYREALGKTTNEYVQADNTVTKADGTFVRFATTIERLETAWGISGDAIRDYAEKNKMSIEDLESAVNDKSLSIYDVLVNRVPEGADSAVRAFKRMTADGGKELNDIAFHMGMTKDDVLKTLADMSGGMIDLNGKTWAELVKESKSKGVEVVDLVTKTSKNSQTALESMDGTKAGYNLMGKANTEASIQAKTLSKTVGSVREDAQATLERMDGTSAGSNLIAGATRGAESKRSSFLGTISSIASAAVSMLSKVWAEHSPSKVAAERAEYFVLGLIEGIKAKRAEFLGSVEAIAEEGVDRLDALEAKDLDIGDINIAPDTYEDGKSIIQGIIDGIETYKSALYEEVEKISEGISARIGQMPEAFQRVSAAFTEAPMTFYSVAAAPIASTQGESTVNNLSIGNMKIDSDSELGQAFIKMAELVLRKERMVK